MGMAAGVGAREMVVVRRKLVFLLSSVGHNSNPSPERPQPPALRSETLNIRHDEIRKASQQTVLQKESQVSLAGFWTYW